MLDFFTECIIRRKKDPKDIAIILGVVLLALILSVVGFYFVFVPLIGQFVFLIVAGIWWGAYIIITGRNVEFEYIVTNGEIDVDRITARRKRKRLISVPAKEIELIALTTEQAGGNITNVIDASTNSKDMQTFFLLTTKDGVRTKILFNPSEKMLKIFKKFRPQNVHFEEERNVE